MRKLAGDMGELALEGAGESQRASVSSHARALCQLRAGLRVLEGTHFLREAAACKWGLAHSQWQSPAKRSVEGASISGPETGWASRALPCPTSRPPRILISSLPRGSPASAAPLSYYVTSHYHPPRLCTAAILACPAKTSPLASQQSKARLFDARGSHATWVLPNATLHTLCLRCVSQPGLRSSLAAPFASLFPLLRTASVQSWGCCPLTLRPKRS